MTRNTCARIFSSWGEIIDVDEPESTTLSYKKLYVKVKFHVTVNGKAKIIVKGKVFWIQIKELETWVPKFTEVNEDDSSSEDEIDGEDKVHTSDFDLDIDNEVDHVSESSCMNEYGNDRMSKKAPTINKQASDKAVYDKYNDPFGIYKILKRNNNKVALESVDPQFPLDSHQYRYNGVSKLKSGGSLLDVMDELIKVGQTMSYNMDRCMHNIEAIIGSQGDGKVASSTKLLIISVYAPQELTEKRDLWDFLHHTIDSWDDECVFMGDFNEVRTKHERYGTVFNLHGANAFNNFINMTGLVDLPLEGYSYTWSHKSASNMSKLDRFLITEGLLTIFPSLSALCLDRHLSDHRPILLRELNVDYGPILFRLFHSWFNKNGFDKMKKLQALKTSIKQWIIAVKLHSSEAKNSIQKCLAELDKMLDQGRCNDELLNERTNLLNDLQNLNSCVASDMIQKAKVRWATEGDENSKYFHGVINKKRSQLAIRGVFIDGEWIADPSNVKHEFLNHFSNKFAAPNSPRLVLESRFPNTLSLDQQTDLERDVSCNEIKNAVWDCGTNKSPGPDGTFPSGCNLSFIALIPKNQEAKVVQNFRPISLIGNMYKIIAKVLANRLSFVISSLISEVQSAFVSNRQILDGPFILNEPLSWCKYKKHKAMVFKVDFKKAFDSVRWDYLDDVLAKFGFGDKWSGWIQGCLNNAKGSILVNGSPTSEFQFYKGLKQGDPLSPFLFILIMESLHLSFKNVENAGLKINLHKSKLIGIGVPHNEVVLVADSIECLTFSMPFNFLGVKVGGIMSRCGSWDDVIGKLSSRLSNWKLKTLSIDGRFTLIKSVLSSLPLYHMSIFKCPMGVLKLLESIRRNFFNGVTNSERKLALIGWKKAIYGPKGFLDNSRIPLRCSPWLDIVLEFKSLAFKGIDLFSFVKKVGNGEDTSFWDDHWLTDSPLKIMYPRLFLLELNKQATIAYKLRDSSIVASFRREPRGGKFSVKSARTFIDNCLLPKLEVLRRWIKVIPIKINIFAWKVCLDKLPTRLNLSLRGVEIPSILCPLCSIALESFSHLLFSCHLARQLIFKVARWWELKHYDLHSYEDWLNWFNNIRLSKRLKEILEGNCYVMWWTIWNFRNQVLFGSK
ncbi:RNA-directed DNA polymerase, eukaryota [Tanacetum coccineum]|uniref:RNA-directed DNA polymerase, eukaryota n=1 Tax=Tanacetum coccineum TaxID=301880 RepID=A0ABQ4YA69_9ASTR